MKRWSSMLLAVVVLALMGLAHLPVPCLGDGAGHACSVERCACTLACSCRLSCQQMAAAPHHACHMAHMPNAEGPSHFALRHAPPMLVAVRLFLTPAVRPGLTRPTEPARFASLRLPLPEPPPRRLA